ncbi:SEC-C domain-containing protein [Bacillaceae bacterium S4-13-58]
MGKGARRNTLCYCGSGKKYKNCCMDRGIAYIPEGLLKPEPMVEPHLNFVKSVSYNGHRMRVIWNTIYPRPINETFHEFLILIVYKLTYGKEFHDYQLSLSEDDRHITFKWWESFCDWGGKNTNKIEKTENGPIYYGEATGDVKSLIQHAYDLYCLQTINRLPDFILNKLKDSHEFQGARYEISVAALIARAGFEINFLDDQYKSEKHCEFIATHKKTGIKIGVEAKSKRRKGILHEDGHFEESTDIRGNIQYLFRNARMQKPEGLPFIIFIDVNLPVSPEIEPHEKSWIRDINRIYDNYKAKRSPKPDPFNALFITNFAYYYGGNQGKTPTWESYLIKSDNPETSIVEDWILDDILNSITRYSRIPKEV